MYWLAFFVVKTLPIMDIAVELELLLYDLFIGICISYLIDRRIYYASLLYSFGAWYRFCWLYNLQLGHGKYSICYAVSCSCWHVSVFGLLDLEEK